MVSLNTVTKVLCKIFLKLVHFIAVLPHQKDKPNFLFYFKILVTLSTQTGFFYVAHQYRLQSVHAVGNLARCDYVEDISDSLGYASYLVITWTYWKLASWKKFYKKLGGFDEPNILENNRCCLLIFCVIAVLHAAIPVIFYKLLKMRKDSLNSIASVIMILCPIFQFYYSYCHAVVILLLIQKIRSDLNIAARHISGKTVNVYMARKLFFKAKASTQFFNSMFGYSLLIMFAQWIYHIIILCLYFIEMLKDNIYAEESKWFVIFSISFDTLLCFIAPCSIAFTSDMVTIEKENFIVSCFQLQQELNCHTPMYQQLQSMALYANSCEFEFVAADYFEVKRSIILSVVATATTYFVALVQFGRS